MFGQVLPTGVFYIGPAMYQTAAALEKHGQRPSSPQRNVGALVCLRTRMGIPTLPGASPCPGSPVSPPPAQEWSAHRSRDTTALQDLPPLSHCHHFVGPI